MWNQGSGPYSSLDRQAITKTDMHPVHACILVRDTSSLLYWHLLMLLVWVHDLWHSSTDLTTLTILHSGTEKTLQNTWTTYLRPSFYFSIDEEQNAEAQVQTYSVKDSIYTWHLLVCLTANSKVMLQQWTVPGKDIAP